MKIGNHIPGKWEASPGDTHSPPAVAFILRAFFRQRLVHSEAAPLEPSTRAFMEKRFGTSFAEVQIHTGRAASLLCAALQARALTLGRDIVFAEGTYALDSEDGRRLLAHELVHVLQQRAAIPWTLSRRVRSSWVAIGDPLDDCEREAERLATQALRGGLQSAVTPDSSGAIRRAVSVVDGMADITTEYKGAKPAIDYVQRGPTDLTRFAILHLTTGIGPVLRNALPPTAAIRLTGTAFVLADTKDNTKAAILANWEFHIVQLLSLKLFKAFYAGQKPANGSMILDFAGPTYFIGHGKYLQDSDPYRKPLSPYSDTWKGLSVQGAPEGGLWKATVINDDHPYTDVPLVLENPVTRKSRNYLYSVRREYDVVTALVASDVNSPAIRPLAYVSWGAKYNAWLHWHNNPDGTVVVDAAQLTTHDFWVKPAIKGAHPDGTLAKMIANPHMDADRMYNRAAKDAYDGVLNALYKTTANSSERAASRSWTPSFGWAPPVPPNHFK
jgi:hypothetical protein